MFKYSQFFCAVVVGICVLGCQKQEDQVSTRQENVNYIDVEAVAAKLLMSPLEITQRRNDITVEKPMKISEMADPDVIVAVNGYPLLKSDFEAHTQMFRPLIQRLSQGDYQSFEMAYGKMRSQYVSQFVKSRLLIDYAQSKNLISEEELKKRTRDQLEAEAIKGKTSFSNVVVKAGEDAKYIFYQAAERVLVKELVEKEIPPAWVVDMTFVSNTQAQVTLENNITTFTNGLRRQKLEGWRGDIMSGRVKFMDLVAKCLEDGEFEVSENGEWETFMRDDIADKAFREIVFSAKEGEILPIQEDTDGIDLIMLDRIIVATMKDGKLVEPEQRVLKRIRMEKLPLFLRQSDESMLKDLKGQAQMQAIETFVSTLATNGLNTVVYPHGKDLF